VFPVPVVVRHRRRGGLRDMLLESRVHNLVLPSEWVPLQRAIVLDILALLDLGGCGMVQMGYRGVEIGYGDGAKEMEGSARGEIETGSVRGVLMDCRRGFVAGLQGM
jgi:hypothetical protein